MRTLIIETSTERGLLALVEDRFIVFSHEFPFGYNQSKFLMPELYQRLQGLGVKGIDCIAVGIGPGSYTGIRVAAAVAKALAYAWKIPLIGIPTLHAFIPSLGHQGPFAVLIDAKIGGVYFVKGRMDNGNIHYLIPPSVCAVEALGCHLTDDSLIVTPAQKALNEKLDRHYPGNAWIWLEVSPSPLHIAERAAEKYRNHEWSPALCQLDLLYLRKTQAELELEKKS